MLSPAAIASPIPALRFTRNAATGSSPLITAAAAADGDFWWHGQGAFVGKQPDIANFPAGGFTLRSRSWPLVTQLNFSNRKLTSFDLGPVLFRLTALTHLLVNANGGLDIDISGWKLPATTIYCYGGDSTLIHGDISGWVLPASLAYMTFRNTLVSGDLSSWILSTTLVQLYLYNTLADYGTGGMMATATRNASTYRFDGCAMTQAEVDRILADANASGTINSTLNVAGTNAAPTGGAGNADYLALVAPARGWTVTIS